MGALQQSAVLIEKANIWVGDNAGNVIDLGAVRKVKFTGKQFHTKVDSDNRGTIVNKLRLNGELDFDWLECGSVSNLAVLFKGAVTKTTVAGSSTPVSGEATASGSWAYSQIIFFVQQAGDLSQPSSITVTGGTDGLLTVNTNY